MERKPTLVVALGGNALLKRGEPLELPAEAFDADPKTGVITYDLNLFPETPAYAIGSMPLYVADIAKHTLDVAHLPKGLELKGNALAKTAKAMK